MLSFNLSLKNPKKNPAIIIDYKTRITPEGYIHVYVCMYKCQCMYISIILH